MSKELKLVPNLRFPSFQKEDHWNQDSVQNLVITKTSPKKLQSSQYLEEGAFPIIDQSQNFYCGYTNDDLAIIKEDLPLIVFGDHTCALKMAREPFAQGADGIKILKPKPSIDAEYLYQYLFYNGVKQENYKRHFSKLKEKLVPFPELDSGEQQKIASCLSFLDELITAHKEKLAALKDHKKGLMQNLFPHKGQKVPGLRFPEFNEHWKLGELEKCLDYLQPTPYLVKSTDYKNCYPTPVLTAGKSFILGFTDEKDGVFDTNLPVIIFDDFTTSSKFVDFPFKTKSSAMKILLAKNGNDIKFIYESMQTLKFQVGGHKRHWISVFSKLKISFPSIKEQQKIASCLSSLDALITAQAERITQLQAHKKGLMQRLFPNRLNHD